MPQGKGKGKSEWKTGRISRFNGGEGRSAVLKRRIAAGIMIITGALFILGMGSGKPEKIPEEVSFEIKLLLDPDAVLDGDGLFTEEFREMLGIEDEYRPIDVAYLETPDRGFADEGWINRLRWKSGKKKAERVYKKRYHVADGDIAEAMAAAAKDGLEPGDERYSAQIDWQYSGMELSFSCERTGKYKDYTGLDRFSLKDAADFMLEEMPGEELDWKTAGWGKKLMERAHMAGPVRFLRAKGTWEDIGLKAEIWPLPDNGSEDGEICICELSAEFDDLASASGARKRLMKYLDENGVLLHEEGMKTRIILDKYLR